MIYFLNTDHIRTQIERTSLTMFDIHGIRTVADTSKIMFRWFVKQLSSNYYFLKKEDLYD